MYRSSLPGKLRTHVINRVPVIAIRQDVAEQLIEPGPLGPLLQCCLDIPKASVDNEIAIGTANIP